MGENKSYSCPELWENHQHSVNYKEINCEWLLKLCNKYPKTQQCEADIHYNQRFCGSGIQTGTIRDNWSQPHNIRVLMWKTQRLESSEDSFTHMLAGWCWLSARAWESTEGELSLWSLCGTAWASLQYGSWVPRACSASAHKKRTQT